MKKVKKIPNCCSYNSPGFTYSQPFQTDAQQYFDNSVPLEETPEELIDLAGYQVTKAELFAHSREPSITFWVNRVKFNMACLRRFPGVTHVQIMINPDEKRMIMYTKLAKLGKQQFTV